MLDNLPDDVRQELLDPDYWGRKHYSRSTYADGCRGPFCRKSERDRGRFRSADIAEEAGREYQPDYTIRNNGEDGRILESLVWYLRVVAPKQEVAL